MSVFSFNFRSKLSNDINGDKENVFKPLTPFSMNSDLNVGQKPSTILSYNTTPTQRSVFANKTNDLAKNQNNFELLAINKKRANDGLTAESTVEQISADSNILKQKVVEELERIETFKAMTEMEINRQSEENKNQKALIEDLENRLVAMRRENSELKVKLNIESTERTEVMSKMNNTRDMFLKVKDYVQHVETRLEYLDDVKYAFDQINETRSRQLTDLEKQFSELDLKHKTVVSDLESDISHKNEELNLLNETFNKKSCDLEVYKSETNKRFDNFVAELNEVKEVKDSLQSALNQEVLQNKNLTSELIALQEQHQLIVTTYQKKSEEFEKLQNDFEIKAKELENEIKSLLGKENDLIEKNAELKSEIEMKEQNIQDLTLEIENKTQLIVDLEKQIKDKIQEITDLLSEKTNLIQMKDEINSKVLSIEAEKQDLEKSFQNEKHSLISDFDKTFKDLESSAETLREENNQLTKLKEENLILIDELKSNFNQSMVEKETIVEKLENDLKELKDELKNKMNEFSTKIEDMQKQIQDLNAVKEQNETTICEIRSESESLKTEREELKQKLEKEERTLENQMSNMSKIVESCKSDYNKRLEDKEERIKEYRRENERMRHSVDHLNKKCERLEVEKQTTNRKLQELTLSAMRPTSSPNRVLTPKFMSPIESTRISSNRSRSPLVKPLDLSPHILPEDDILSAKQECQQNIKVRENSQKVAPVFKQKAIKSKEKSESKQLQSNRTELKKSLKLNDSNSSESVYEFIQGKIKPQKRGNHKKSVALNKHRIDSPVKVNMSLADDKRKGQLDIGTDVFDIEMTDKEQPFKKKFKVNATNLKTYAKKEVRAENILKGRPTPTKEDDLSWLDF